MRDLAFIICLTLSFQGKGLELNYDKSKNQTTASTSSIEIKLKENYVTKTFDFKIQYAFAGERLIQRPENANIVFRALSHRWRFLEESNRQAVLFMDGERFSLSSKPTYTSVIGEKFLEETLIYEIRISDIEKLAKAPNIEIQIGGVEGIVREKQLARIKDFLSALQDSNVRKN
ncbi:MAG: hypothetical protein L0226_07330 [Acidobacteria bacterium]|nr:hypothetical protein [Acidobacteriota bacterium]